MDFQERYGLAVRDYLGNHSWNEAWELTRPLLASPYSHTAAAIRKWSRPPEPVEAVGFLLMDFYLAANRRKNATKPRPIERPWEKRPPSRPAMTAADKRLRAELKASLGLD